MYRLRVCSVAAGAGVAVAAQLAPLDDRFWAHMIQHLLIADLGPLLVALGLVGLGRPLRIPPAVALPVWALLLVGWHLTPLYDAALDHAAVHLVQHVSFFVAGLAVWSVILGDRLSTVWKLPYVGATWLVSLALSQIFMWSGHPYYGRYSLSDQRAGGGVMLVEGSFVMLGVVVWLLLRLFSESETRQQALDTAWKGSA
jgi:putative membrane protein